MTLLTLACIWVSLALAVLVLAMARKWISRREDDTVHLADSEAPLVQQRPQWRPCSAAWIAGENR